MLAVKWHHSAEERVHTLHSLQPVENMTLTSTLTVLPAYRPIAVKMYTVTIIKKIMLGTIRLVIKLC
jgi:hypothetical protein